MTFHSLYCCDDAFQEFYPSTVETSLSLLGLPLASMKSYRDTGQWRQLKIERSHHGTMSKSVKCNMPALGLRLLHVHVRYGHEGHRTDDLQDKTCDQSPSLACSSSVMLC